MHGNTRLTVYVWPRIRHRLPVDVFWSLDGLWLWLVRFIPRSVVYWAGVRLLAHATSGQYSDTHVANVSGIEMLRRWQAKRDQGIGATRYKGTGALR